jgi:pimeloyl-ACP methyl ester carboxylesterase
MPVLKGPDAEIYYEVYGKGFPLLLFAPGGLRSNIEFWQKNVANPAVPPAYMNPMVALADSFTVVGMDQRNAGKSRGKVAADHGWHTYAADHLALMDHLGFKKFHVMGGCIGGSYCLKICETAPDRVTAAVLQNPIGLHENRQQWDDSIRNFTKTMQERDPSVSAETIASFGRNMFGGDFVFSVSRDFVQRCPVPLYLQPGSDLPHPAATSEEIAKLNPKIEVQNPWKGPDHLQESIRRVRDFLIRNTPR